MSNASRLFLAILCAGILGLSGCLVGGSSSVHREGSYISEDTLRQVEPGKTSESWVLATLGKPTEKSEIANGYELWKYSYKETKDSNGYVFLLFGGSDQQVTGGKVFVELKNGVVTKCWRG
jgi:outer membrane protein assembly factor BamE (lipoprotein component of BamABCDE complex)